MPGLKPLLPLLGRYTPSNPDDVHPAPEHQYQHDFEVLLNRRPPSPMSQPPLDDARQPHLRAILAQAFAADLKRLRTLGRTCPGTLNLRMTNGPLAGLEIRASAHANLLYLCITVAERGTFERIFGTHAALETELLTLFNRPVALELKQPNGAPW